MYILAEEKIYNGNSGKKENLLGVKKKWFGRTYCGMIVCKGIVDAHIFKEPANLSLKEPLYFSVIKL